MAKFSERIGLSQPRQVQLHGMDDPLRHALWNWLHWALDKPYRTYDTWVQQYWYRAAKVNVWDEFMKEPIDELPNDPKDAIKAWFMARDWNEVYEFVEFVLPRVNEYRESLNLEPDRRDVTELLNRLNAVLEREGSGYRVVDGRFVPITSAVEISEIEAAATVRAGFEGVAEQIKSALGLLGKKPEPDYRNSVKESISAVEGAVKLLTGESSGGIRKALALLDKTQRLHPSFRNALVSLYGYASDEDGIRHPILDEATVGEPEARFMLVTCSAFVNLLISTRSNTV